MKGSYEWDDAPYSGRGELSCKNLRARRRTMNSGSRYWYSSRNPRASLSSFGSARMNRFARVDAPRASVRVDGAEVRVTTGGKMRDYVSYAAERLEVRDDRTRVVFHAR